MESELTTTAISKKSDSQTDSRSTPTASKLETSTALPEVPLETLSKESIYEIINSTITQTAAPNLTSQKAKKTEKTPQMGMQLDTWILVLFALAFILVAAILLALFVALCCNRSRLQVRLRPVRPAAMEQLAAEGGAQEGSESSGVSTPSSLYSVLKMLDEEVVQADREDLPWEHTKAQRAREQRMVERVPMLVLYDKKDREGMFAASGF